LLVEEVVALSKRLEEQEEVLQAKLEVITALILRQKEEEEAVKR